MQDQGDRSGVSRRALLGASGAAFFLSLAGLDLVAAPRARASVAWNYPFTFRSYIPTDGEFGNLSQARIDAHLGAHSGVDLVADYYTPIYNCAPGTVVVKGTGGSWGHHVKIQHSDGSVTGYAHMTAGTVTVDLDQVITTTQVIGGVGTTGTAFGPHLHLTLQPTLSGSYIPPDPILNSPLAVPGVGSQLLYDEDYPMFLIYASDANATPPVRYAVTGPGYWMVFTGQAYANGMASRFGDANNLTWAEWDRAFAAAVSSGFVPASGQTSRTI